MLHIGIEAMKQQGKGSNKHGGVEDCAVEQCEMISLPPSFWVAFDRASV